MAGARGKAAVAAVEVESVSGSTYPAPFAAAVRARTKRRLGDVFGLTNFGVNLVEVPPGTLSSQRHWHTRQDEFVYVLEGELVLVTDAGEQVLTPGMAAGFPAGAADGHHLVNRTNAPAVYLEVGDRTAGDEVDYPDIDMLLRRDGDGRARFVRKDGTPYD
ncbi:MAG: cupin domain-containing protein [Hyphomicrobiales bacterium]|nr:cupin domain-containing protein [Hyphomicrobiales bacterium]MCP5373907.1 cupin domain-containing protein [Hyphomicrobiales bacterium]